MSNISTISGKEVKDIQNSYGAVTNLHYGGGKLHTIDDAVEQYNKAEEISNIVKQTVKDGLQGQALLFAKKEICGDEWNKALTHQTSKKWKEFLKVLNLIDKNDNQKVNVKYLLDFAGYKEVEAELIEQGVKVTPIDTASHYREVKKHSEVKEHGAIATEYTELVEKNDGVKPETAKEIKEKMTDTIYVKPIFEAEHPRPESPMPQMTFTNELVKKIPNVNKSEWKKAYREISKVFHEDSGSGDNLVMSIINHFDEMMSLIYRQEKLIEAKEKHEASYEIWKEEHGYQSDFIER